MPIFELDSIPQVALAFVNADHREEARLLNELGAAIEALEAGKGSRGDVLAAFRPLFDHTREHFAREEQAMQRVGFPPYPVHKMEHDRVLAELADEGQSFERSGDAKRLWHYVSQVVPAWFIGHIQSMDTVTSQFVAMRGG